MGGVKWERDREMMWLEADGGDGVGVGVGVQ